MGLGAFTDEVITVQVMCSGNNMCFGKQLVEAMSQPGGTHVLLCICDMNEHTRHQRSYKQRTTSWL